MALDLEKIDLGSFGVNEVEDNRKTQINANISEAIRVNPVQHAELNQLSKQSGVPAFAIESNPDEVKNKLQLDKINVDSLIKDSPATSKFVGSNFNNAVIAQNDVIDGVYQSIENGLNNVKQYGSDVVESFQKGQRIVESSDIGLRRMYHNLGIGEPVTDADIEKVKQLDYLSTPSDKYGFITGAPVTAAEQLPIMYEILESGALFAGAGAAGGATTGAIIGGLPTGGVGILPGAIAGAIPGAKVGGRLGVAKAAFDLEAGMAFNEFAALKDEQGNTLDPQIASIASVTVGGINAALEFVSLAALGRTVTPAIRMMIRSRVRQSLATETGRQVLKRLGANYLTAVVTEGATESAQEFTNVLAGEFAKFADKDSFTEQNLEAALDNIFSAETGERVLQAGTKGAQAALVLSAPGTVTGVVLDQRRQQQLSNNEQKRIDSLAADAEASQSKQIDVESFKQFVREADGDNNTTVFIDGAQVTLYLQGKTRAEIEADPALKILDNAARESRELGTDAAIPVDVFAGDISGTEHFAQLRDSMTMSNESVSPFRQEQAQVETQNYIKTLINEAETNASEYVQAQEIFTNVRDQLIDSGVVNAQNASIMAQIVPAWATAQSKRTGKTVEQVYQESGLIIEGPQTGELSRLQGEQVLTQGLTYNPEDTVKQYPIAPRSEWYGDADFAQRDGRVVMVNPQDYLDSVRPLTIDEESQDNIDDLVNHIEEGRQLDPLALYETGKEDGRHRAYAALRLGIDQVPVIVFGDQSLPNEAPFEDTANLLAQAPVDNVEALTSSIESLGVDISIHERDDSIQLSKIIVPSELRNEGVGSLVLSQITDYADKVGKPIRLTPSKDFGATSIKRLIDFYKRAGFVENKGRNKDYSFSDSMYREPQQREQFAQSQIDQTETEAFKKWSENGEVVEPYDVNDYEFKADTPVVLKVFHGTTHEFSVFDALRGNLEGQFGAINYFTSSEQDASDNYAGEGPDLTNRIEQRSEQLVDEIQDVIDEAGVEAAKEQFGEEFYSEDTMEFARNIVRQELSGGFDQTMELFVKVKNPFVIGENAQWIEFVDNDEIQNLAIEEVAGNNGVTVEEVNNNLDDYEDEIDEARWAVQEDQEHPLIEAIQTVSDRYDIAPSELLSQVYELGEEATPAAIEELLRGSEDYAYAEDSDTGSLIGSQLIAEVIEEMGFDSIILKNAEGRFSNMNMERDTAHVHIFDSNKTNIKSVDNQGTFDPADPDIFKQPTSPSQDGARGYYDPANSIIRLTEAADLSTFLHEFAHFMYEMELNNKSDMVQSINNWYKRNAEEVAKEANEYLGEKFDALKQSTVEIGKLTVFHGTDKEFDKFSEFRPAFFTTDEKYASAYGSKVKQFTLDVNKPFDTSTDEFAREYYNNNFRSDPLGKDAKKLERGDVIPFIDADNFWSFISVEEEMGSGHGYDAIIVNEQTGVTFTTNKSIVPLRVSQIEQFKDADSDLLLAQTQPPAGSQGSITEEDVANYLDNETTGDTNKDAAIRRAVHEQFARGFETYLMEGKAPSIELRNAFRAFARWLTRIYQAFKGDLKVNLDEEMKQVYDRLIATDEQIAAAESRARVEPMFTDAAMAGMTEQEFSDYQKRQEKVKDIQAETLRDKLIKELTRKTQSWWKEEKQDMVDEEIDQLSNEQVYIARTRLKDGDIKLDHATVKEMTGEERTDKLGRKSTRIPDSLRGMTAKGQKGVHPDEAAAFFGYNSGSEMLNDLVNAPVIQDVAEANAEQRMIDKHGDILNDGSITQLADEAVQNEERGKLILHELKIVSRGTNQKVLDRQTIKAIAEERIGRLSFREIHPGKYRKAEIRSAQESTRMLAEGNKEGAAQAKARQVLNYYLGMAANDAKNNITDIVDRMNRYNKKKVREEIQKAEGGYWEQIVKILDRFEFRKSATLAQVDTVNQDINTWAKERMEVEGDGLVLHNAVLNESYVTHWKNVAYSDLQGINDSVKNIEHVARYANKLTRMGEQIEFDKLVTRWTTSMNENVKTRFKSKRTDVIEGRKWGRWLMAQMTKIPFMASWLDGGERVGISHQVMVQPFIDAYNEEIKLWGVAGKPVMEAIQNRDKATRKRHNRKIYIPEIEDNLYGHQIIAVALNTGNDSNLRKLLLGEGWADPESEEITFNNGKLQAVLQHMTKSDWELVQMIWDQMGLLYPQLADVHRRTTGLVPPKVEATPVQTPYGEFKGGYYPIKYDPNRSHRAAQFEDRLNAETESMFSNTTSIQASVNAGSTNERTQFYAPIRLSLDVVPSHFQETIHYITHHDAVREVNKLTRDARVAEVIKEKLGPEEYAQLKPWLNDIAKDGREAPTKMFWDDILARLRFGVTLGAMGFKASTGIIQISGLSNTISEVGLSDTLRATRSILGSTTTMREAWDFAVENSKVMEHRAQTMDREIKNAMAKIEGKRGVTAAVQEASMKHIALIQTYMVDLPSWHAAYMKGMNEWGDETRAFQYADFVVEQVQGSGATKDLARIMRNQTETGRMFTMFMTFFSSLWNIERDLVKGARSGYYSVTNVAAKAMFLFTLPVLFEMMMRGELGDDDDDETVTEKMLTGVALYPIQSVPFIRDVANATAGDFGYNISPMQQIMEQGVVTIPEIVKRGFTDEEITKGQIKGATKFIGAAAGIPGTAQAWATGEHLYDVVAEGEELTLHQVLFGPDK